MNRQNIIRSISSSFSTVWHYSTKFGVNQIMMAVTLASISGISRFCRIAAFSGDGLIKALLKLDEAINENAISAALKNIGESGARKLQGLFLSKNARWLGESGLENITLDADSTVAREIFSQFLHFSILLVAVILFLGLRGNYLILWNPIFGTTW